MKKKKAPLGICCVEGCSDTIKTRNNIYCNRHDLQIRRHGKITDALRKVKNLPDEEWRQVTYPKKILELQRQYYVSNMGRLKSIDSFNNERLLTPNFSKRENCLKLVTGNGCTITMSSAVMRAFKGWDLHSDGQPVFVDGNRRNVKLSNLKKAEEIIGQKSFLKIKSEVGKNKYAGPIFDYMRGIDTGIKEIWIDLYVLFAHHLEEAQAYYERRYYKPRRGIDEEAVLEKSIERVLRYIKRGGLKSSFGFEALSYTAVRSTLLNTVIKNSEIRSSSFNEYGERRREYELFDSGHAVGFDWDMVTPRTPEDFLLAKEAGER